MRRWLIALVSVFFVFAFFLPKIATTVGKPIVLRALRAKTHAEMTIDSIHFSWFGPQIFHQIHWTQGLVTGTIEELQMQAPFWSFSGPLYLKNGTIVYGNTLHFASQNIHAQWREHSITLQDPLTAECTGLSFLASLGTIDPITIQITTKDFFFPIPFSIEKCVAQGQLDLRQTQCPITPSLASFIRLLKATPSKQINIQFTPLPFRIERGHFEAFRMDALLADSIHVCTWGHIDLLHDQIHMFLGIPAKTLAKSFGIKNLRNNYTLTLPIRGTIKNPEIVKGPTLTKIEDIPQAKRPFPWEGL